MSNQVVDTPTAEEFMREIAERVSGDELDAIAAEVRTKAEGFHRLLGEGRAAGASREDLWRVLRSVFGTRRRTEALLAGLGERLPAEIDRLLHGDEALAARFERFEALVRDLPGGFELPAELLHYTYPDRHWLWTRWMWDPRNETGALPLVTLDEVDLSADTMGGSYLRVGEAVAFVNETGKAAGFARAGEGLLGTDLFLACVYGIYMYTVLRMRMTREFTQVVPGLPELVRRLLGVRRLEV